MTKRSTAVDTAELTARIQRVCRSHAEQQKHISEQWTEWTQAEIAAGRSTSTEAPEAVLRAVARIDRERADALHRLHADAAPGLRAELRERQARIDALYGELVTEMDGLRDFERRARWIESQCNVPVTPRIEDDAITSVGLQEWRLRADRVLNPPAPKAQQRQAPRALEISI